MFGIKLCDNEDCPLKKDCWRSTVERSEDSVYGNFKYERFHCKEFLSNHLSKSEIKRQDAQQR